MNDAATYCSCPAKVGQVAGEVITRQVVNESLQPIANIAFFYVDKNGEQTSGHSVVDDNGLFHVTYPQAPNEIFIQFNSYDPATNVYTDTYEAKVVSFIDLYNSADGSVMMKKPGAVSSSSNLPVILAGGLLGLVALSSVSKKKVGAVSMQTIKDKATAKNIAIFAGVGIGAYLLIKSLFGYKPTQQQLEIIATAKSKLDELHFDYGIDVTMSLTQFASLASALRNASVDCGTDESAILHVMEQLNNEADIYQLIVTAGIMSYKSCAAVEGNWFGNVHYTVPELVVSELTSNELNTVNDILSSKGINFRF